MGKVNSRIRIIPLYLTQIAVFLEENIVCLKKKIVKIYKSFSGHRIFVFIQLLLKNLIQVWLRTETWNVCEIKYHNQRVKLGLQDVSADKINCHSSLIPLIHSLEPTVNRENKSTHPYSHMHLYLHTYIHTTIT